MKRTRISEQNLKTVVDNINRKYGYKKVSILRYIDWLVQVDGKWVNDKQWKNNKVWDYLWNILK